MVHNTSLKNRKQYQKLQFNDSLPINVRKIDSGINWLTMANYLLF